MQPIDLLRISAKPGQLINRDKTVCFTYNGKTIVAFQGDTVGSALHASGVTIFTRSFKYHRPRGLLCMSGRCANCLVSVDGVPNVRACTEVVREGMVVNSQNAWPSVDDDLLSILDRFDWAMPVAFYYKAFHQPKNLWKLVQPFIRRISGLGKIDVTINPPRRYRHINLHADVAVIGGGPSGMSAAIAASKGGGQITLIDDQDSLGGHLRLDSSTHNISSLGAKLTGQNIAHQLSEQVDQNPNINVLTHATAFGWYADNLLGILTPNRFIQLRAKHIIFATGSNEVPHVFENNDLPGIMLSSGALRLLHLYGLLPGRRAVVVSGDDHGYKTAVELQSSGVRVAAVVDSRGGFPSGLPEAQKLKDSGVRVLNGYSPLRADGPKRLSSVTVAANENGRLSSQEVRFECDLLITSGAFEPSMPLLRQAGVQFSYDENIREMVPTDTPSTITVSGRATGLHRLPANIVQGRIAGLNAAVATGGLESAEITKELHDLKRELKDIITSHRVRLSETSDVLETPGNKGFICLCEDVTSKDLVQGIKEGFTDIQSLKRYTTATMGPCQGKMCHRSVSRLCASTTSHTVAQTGTTTQRPPISPIPLGALAGHIEQPIKHTPLIRRNLELDAHFTDMGAWQRVHTFTNAQEEARAIRERVGLIDVTTLGKLDVRGKDTPELLDHIYTNRMSDLKIGRIRYGVMCSENGSIIDDGTVSRLSEDRYFVTTTSGNIEAIEEWIKWWLAGTGMCGHTNNLTGAYAAINVAGPKARETLGKLTEVDISSDVFKYMRFANGLVAGVPSTLLRIGFVGETGWEVHFPAEYGEHIWDALMDAGKEFDISPCGIEAQRILRLEKKHIIVTQDTDSITTPVEADMEWAVKMDKEDFVGRGSIRAIKERGPRHRIVGFVMQDSLVPEDGAAIVSGGFPIGRVTSSRFSSSLAKGVGLAWVPIGVAKEGQEILIRIADNPTPAIVTFNPFYDPDGKRLRE